MSKTRPAPKQGYLYILMRADFIAKRQHIYKIGQTGRFPPHKRLWDYPYGSIFLTLFQCNSPVKFESELKKVLGKTNAITNCKEIGDEYYEGNLQVIIDLIKTLSVKYQIEGQELQKLSCPLNPNHLLVLNRIHYLPQYDQSFFHEFLKCQYYLACDQIPSELIYDSYQKARQWNTKDYPDNYVIRCGMTSLKPLSTN
jgi:hypothetical protein